MSPEARALALNLQGPSAKKAIWVALAASILFKTTVSTPSGGIAPVRIRAALPVGTVPGKTGRPACGNTLNNGSFYTIAPLRYESYRPHGDSGAAVESLRHRITGEHCTNAEVGCSVCVSSLGQAPHMYCSIMTSTIPPCGMANNRRASGRYQVVVHLRSAQMRITTNCGRIVQIEDRALWRFRQGSSAAIKRTVELSCAINALLCFTPAARWHSLPKLWSAHIPLDKLCH
jgi:hypothetical protein